MRNFKKALLVLLLIAFLVLPRISLASPQLPQLQHFAKWIAATPMGVSAMSILQALYFLDQQSYEELTPDQIKAIEELKAEFLNEAVKIIDKKYSFYLSAKKLEEQKESQKFEGAGLQITVPEAKEKSERFRNYIKQAFPCIKDEDFEKREYYEHGIIKSMIEYLLARNVDFKLLDEQIRTPKVSDKGILVVDVVPGTGAEKAGMKIYKDWFITHIDGRKAEGLLLKEAIKLIKGPRGTKVKLSLKSTDGSNAEVEVERGVVSSSWLEAKMVSRAGIGYIKISEFMFQDPKTQKPTADPFIKAVEELKAEGMSKMILDLRGNLGGYLDEADLILDHLLSPGLIEILAKFRDKQWFPYFSVPETDVPKIFPGPIVILVDGHSASASELISISLKEHKRAVIIGEKTYGKGSILGQYPLVDGGVLRMLTGHYFSPILGKCVEGEGIIPDIVIRDNPDTPEDEVLDKAIKVLSYLSVYYGFLDKK